MPLLLSQYKPTLPFRNGHFATVYSSKLRPIPILVQERERLLLEDGDFLDIDWSFSKSASKRLAILLHGLEGNAQRPYIKGQGNILQKNNWDIAAINFRGCSGEPNLLYQSYNAGKTDDLEAVINYVLEKNKYSEIALIGFSLGGNLLLKYLGERHEFPEEIKKAVAISTPLCLKGSLHSLEHFHNWIYRKTFLTKMRKKFKVKMNNFPKEMSVSNYNKINSLFEFDNIYTAPAHGFKDAFDYYKKNSSLQFLPNIHIPIYILNAENDSFLSPKCYPRQLASKMKNLNLEIPKYGGHVGFYKTNKVYYSEARVLEFLET
ncbi:MAG TPA: alpha/beta fold hydrolase [Aequorivita sp.]|nr:alpha/beta fold hydrolase [Aequorivita sp.]